MVSVLDSESSTPGSSPGRFKWVPRRFATGGTLLWNSFQSRGEETYSL